MLTVHVHPGARREALRGWRADGALRLDVGAPPERGRANDAVTALLAGVLGVPRGRVAVVRGHGSRTKVVEVTGLDADDLKRRIETALAAREADNGR